MSRSPKFVTTALPVTYSIQSGLLHIKMQGEYLPEDIQGTVLSALQDPRLPENTKFLFDVTASKSLSDRSADDLQAMAQFLASKSDRFGSRMGMVAAQQLHYGLLRMAEVYSEISGLEARVFYTVEEATEWLNCSADSED